MGGNRARWRHAPAGLLAAATFVLGACAGHHLGSGGHEEGEGGVNAFPANYKSDILAAMHAYLNDPTGIQDALIAPPVLKEVSGSTRYIACLRFNGKRDNGNYAGETQIAAVFLAGRFDDFTDAAAAREPCAGAAFAPFPELEQLKR
jgi:hypothetical protein